MRRLSWLLILLLTIPIINYPNPFSPNIGEVTTIECTPTETTEAFLYIYDMSAKLILRRAFNLQGGALNQTTWDGYSDYNELVGNCIYPYLLVDKTNRLVGKGKIWVINQ